MSQDQRHFVPRQQEPGQPAESSRGRVRVRLAHGSERRVHRAVNATPVLALGLAMAACHPASPTPPTTALPQGCATVVAASFPIRGAIFSPSWGPSVAKAALQGDVVGFWAPPRDVIAALEAGLRPALEAGRARPETLIDLPKDLPDRVDISWGVSAALKEILEGFADYRCQYLGIVIAGGHRRVLVNCFTKDAMTHFDQSWFDANAIDDGGSSFWRIQYDVASCRFMDFDVNASG